MRANSIAHHQSIVKAGNHGVAGPPNRRQPACRGKRRPDSPCGKRLSRRTWLLMRTGMIGAAAVLDGWSAHARRCYGRESGLLAVAVDAAAVIANLLAQFALFLMAHAAATALRCGRTIGAPLGGLASHLLTLRPPLVDAAPGSATRPAARRPTRLRPARLRDAEQQHSQKNRQAFHCFATRSREESDSTMEARSMLRP